MESIICLLLVFACIPWGGILALLGRQETFRVDRGVDNDLNAVDSDLLQDYTDISTILRCVMKCMQESVCQSVMHSSSRDRCELYRCPHSLSSVRGAYEWTYLSTRTSKDVSTACSAPYLDCQDAFANGERSSGASFCLQTANSASPFLAVCEFDGVSGWTVIQRRLDGCINFEERVWDEYMNGFGDLTGEYWLGLEHIYELTRTNKKLSVFLEDHEGETRTANYSNFEVADSNDNYRLHVDGYSGDAGDGLINQINRTFTTPDMGGCASTYRGGWWYHGCHHCQLNGVYLLEPPYETSGQGVAWYYFKNQHYSMKTAKMRLSRD